MTLRFAEIQQELKVAAAECRAASDYKRFVHAYKPALDLSDQAMLSVFRDNSVGDTGTSAYAAFKAQLVSNSLLRSARNKAAFCAEARSEFSAAFSGEGALEGLISSSQPYVDIPFKDCAEAPSTPSAPIVAQQAAPPTVARQPVQVANANIAQMPVAPPSIRPDPWAETAPPASAAGAADLVHVVPHHAPLVPATPQLSRPAPSVLAAPQFDVAATPPPSVAFARVVPHDAPVVPAVPQMTRPAASAAAAPQFDVAAPAMFARVVPHHAPFVPSVPAMAAPARQFSAAPRFAVARETEPVLVARVVPHHARFVPAVPRMTAPEEQATAAPHFAIATPPVAIARAEEPIVIRHDIPRRSALRPAGLVLFHPRPAAVDAPDVEVARVAPAAAPVRREASDSSVVRGLARLSAIAAAMIKREAAADAAEPPAQTRPMVASVKPAPHQADMDVATRDDLAIAAGRAADILRSEPDPHPERRVAARQPVNVGTAHRRMVAATLVLPAKRGIPLSALNPTIEASRVDQVAVVQPHAVPAPSQALASATAMNDESAVAVTGRADTGTPKLAHGFMSAKATTYGRPAKPAGGGANTSATNNSPVMQIVPDAPSAALMPQDQNPDQDQNLGSDQNDDQQSAPNNNQDDQYGPAYAYDDGYARARARARAWRRRIIDAYETYRRRSVPEDYSGDYPPPPPWRSDSGNDSWSDQ